jgi:alanine racemase
MEDIKMNNVTNSLAWAEIDLKAIAHNVKVLVELSQPCKLMAVVKADAYGHGAVDVSKVALQSGAYALGVHQPAEGERLRKAGIEAPILVLSAINLGQEEILLENDLTATVTSYDAALALGKQAKKKKKTARLHIKVDTGMGRQGVFVSELEDLYRKLSKIDNVRLEGLYTHFSSSETPSSAHTVKQVKEFNKAIAVAKRIGWQMDFIHMANTGALLSGIGKTFCTMVRIGLGIYGLYPDNSLKSVISLNPALSVKTHVTGIKRVPAGTCVSYGMTYTTRTETTLVIVPLGYADGFSRLLSGKAQVLIQGQRFPVVGRICMDQCVVEVGDFPVNVGDEVVVLGKQGDEQITADEWAEKLGTINYEVVTNIGPRVKRYYVR